MCIRDRKSYELFARHVMPHFQGQIDSLTSAADRAQATRDGHAEKQLIAVEEAAQTYEEQRDAVVDLTAEESATGV